MAPITLSKADADSVAPGATRCLTASGGASVIAHRSRAGLLTVAPNVCEHWGSFGMSKASADIEDCVLICPIHQSKLDASTMTYTSDPSIAGVLKIGEMKGRKHAVYKQTICSDGSIALTPPPGAAAGGSALSRLLAALVLGVTALFFLLRLAPPGSLPAVLEQLPLRRR
jgi:nitrite reductase/ring-hydroxylating ferredoxin subunit